MREFRLAVGPYAGGPVGDQIRAAAIALDQCGLSEVADWVRSLDSIITEAVDEKIAENEISDSVLEDVASDLGLVLFLGYPRQKAGSKKSSTTPPEHRIYESWEALCGATNKDVDLKIPSPGDLCEEINPEALTALLVEARDSDDLKEAVRKAIVDKSGSSEGLLGLLKHADVQDLLEDVLYQTTEDLTSYRKEVSTAFKDGALLNLLREGDVGDLIRRALLSEEWRTEALSAIAESFETKAW